MDTDRLKADVQALQNTTIWGDVELVRSDQLRGILIHEFPYPDGWQPRRADFLLDIPDAYPRQPPDVYIPKHLEYTAGSVTRLRRHGSTANWWKWCIEDTAWDGRSHDFGAFIGTIQDSLANPDRSNPYHDPDDTGDETKRSDSGGLLGRLLGDSGGEPS